MKRWGSHAVLPGYLVLTLILTWPLARDLDRALPTVVPLPDALLQAYILDWDVHTLFRDPGRVFDAPMFHPERRTLTYMDHLLGESVVAAPVAAVTRDPAVAYNAVVLFAFVASAWAVYRLARLLGVSRAGAFLAGLLFEFGPYRYCNLANLNLLQTEFIPLGLLFVFRFVHRDRARDLWGLALALAAQSYFSWYYTFYLAIGALVVGIVAWSQGRLRGRPRLVARVALAALGAALLIAPGVWPYLEQRRVMPEFRRTLGMAAYWAADLLDYARTNVENRWLRGIRALTGDQPYFPGIVAVALAVVGLRSRWRDPDARALAVLGISGFTLSLGPVLKVAGRLLWIPLPYAVLFYVVPGFASMRASGRFAVLVLLAAATLAGFGYDALRRGVTAPPWARLAFPLALAVAVAATWSVPLPQVAFPKRRDLPPIYAWLERQPGEFAMLDLPVPRYEWQEGQREVTRQIYAIYHRKPRVDSVSGFVSPAHRAFREIMQRFPAPEAIRAARERDARIIIVHYGDWPPAERVRLREAAARAPGLERVASSGDDVAYQVTGVGAQ